MSREAALKALYARYAKDPAFDSLRAHGGPKRVCPGRGSLSPQLVLVGEAPGRAEATTRKPFQGAAGQVLTDVLTSIGYTRSDVFITNVVKYRPTIGASVRNRTPRLPEQIASWPYLREELEQFPGVPVVVMGGVALAALGSPEMTSITRWHGRGWYDADRMYFAWFHPAVAVYDPRQMDVLLDDARGLVDMLHVPY